MPTVLRNYLHEEAYEARSADMYDLVMRIMQSGRFSSDQSAIEVLVSTAIGLAQSRR